MDTSRYNWCYYFCCFISNVSRPSRLPFRFLNICNLYFSCLILKHRGILCGPISDGYESRAITTDLKEDTENRRNQQVYSASPVKTVDKCNDSGHITNIL